MPVVGNVRVQGQTPKQLEASLNQLYGQELKDPKTTVRIDKSPSQVVYVEGQVGKPGAARPRPGIPATRPLAAPAGVPGTPGANNVARARGEAAAVRRGGRAWL